MSFYPNLNMEQKVIEVEEKRGRESRGRGGGGDRKKAGKRTNERRANKMTWRKGMCGWRMEYNWNKNELQKLQQPVKR